jgi:hypothetical protein
MALPSLKISADAMTWAHNCYAVICGAGMRSLSDKVAHEYSPFGRRIRMLPRSLRFPMPPSSIMTSSITSYVGLRSFCTKAGRKEDQDSYNSGRRRRLSRGLGGNSSEMEPRILTPMSTEVSYCQFIYTPCSSSVADHRRYNTHVS